MLRRETVYRMAGRRLSRLHDEQDPQYVRHLSLALQDPEQTSAALQALQTLDCLETLSDEAGVLVLQYHLDLCSLQQIEAFLQERGFALSTSVTSRVARAWFHYCEDTLRRNRAAPQRLLKNSNEVYVQAYEQHLHGDHDETPPDLREVK